MAIEFDCPYCTATIRVPDAYGGKQGRCPKCDTRMLVPMVARPDSAPVAKALSATEPEGVQGTTESLPVTEEFQIRPAAGVGPVHRRRPARRRTSRTLVIGIPVLFFLVILGIVGYTLINILPELNGELFARQVDEESLPRVTIPWSDTGLSSEDQDVLREFLKTTPETFSSQVMTCRFIGAEQGIEVRLTAGSGHEWFAVDTTTSKPLALWLKKERSALNTQRVAVLQQTLQTYCRDKIAKINGEPATMDVMSVRDNIGINAMGGPLSFVVQAVSGKQAVPCSGEDADGTIYFCLQRGTLAFQIQGRTLPNKTKPFAGEFSAIVVPSQPVSSETKSEGKSDATPTEGSPSEGAPGENTAEPTDEAKMPKSESPADGDSKDMSSMGEKKM